MRRLGGILLLTLLAACEPAGGDATVATVPTAAEEPTTTTPTAPATTTPTTAPTTTAPTTTAPGVTSASTSSTTSTIVHRPTTTATPARVTVVTTAPETRQAPASTTTTAAAGGRCDPNYGGACVPIDSDVDCAGGSGNGPSYTSAKNIQVIGRDIYGLDGNDNDGIGCESPNR